MTITSITYSIAGTPSTRLHLQGEVKVSDLNSEVARDFEGHTTNHFGKSENVIQNSFIELGNDVEVTVEVDDIEDAIINFSNVHDFEETHVKYCVLARMIFAATM